jgi:ribosomal protein S1
LEDGVVGLLPKSKALEDPQFPFEKLRPGDEAVIQVAEIKFEERRISLKVPHDAGQDEWKEYTPAQTSSLGTLGDQFRQFFDKKKK